MDFIYFPFSLNNIVKIVTKPFLKNLFVALLVTFDIVSFFLSRN